MRESARKSRPAREKLDTESAIGRFVLRTLASLAEMERDVIRERTRFALHHKAAKGQAVSRAARGLRIVDGRLANDPESDGVRMYLRARELRSQGRSFRAIAAQLTAEGYRPTRSGAGDAIAAQVVRYMLKNPRLRAIADAA
jgi:DNA invertase Pin-like site-specific DNA recombinase